MLNPKRESKTYTDEELVSEILKNKNQELFGALYDRHSNWVYNKCRQMLQNDDDAEDCTHDLFLKLFVDLAKFSGKSKFKTWLHRVVYNQCIDLLKATPIEQEIEEVEVVDFDYEHEERLLMEKKYEMLEKALEAMKPNQKWLLLAKYKDEMSIKELATSLEIGESAVKMQLSRARKFVIEFRI